MIIEHATNRRELNTAEINTDFVVIGGGLAGVCAAIAAARHGVKTVLVQDRPVLGGNASSEVRLWVLGATSHLGNNNRWSREGGILNEILEENLYRNHQGNGLIFDTILLEKCIVEKNLTLLLNTAAFDIEKSDPDTISAVHAFCPQNSTRYLLRAPLFCDASGDGLVGFMAGAAFRMGAESKEEFGEGFAPDAEYGQLLGHSMYFSTKDVGVPVKFVPPSWALKDITKIPRYRQFNTNMQGCNFWWLEYGGRLDTIHQTEEIKWELWKVVYGVWDYIKNSGNFPEAETMTLEWVGHVPGKRESRRFEGDYIIRQQDVVDQTYFDDVVAHGGWAVDLHPADGVYSEKSGCTQWHSKGVYGIPWRCYYSHNISNLMLAGRIISATHVAFGSTRVMATCAAGGQAVGTAAALCLKHKCLPAAFSSGEKLSELQLCLQRDGQFLPNKIITDPDDLAAQATASASSHCVLTELPANDTWMPLESSCAMLVPLTVGKPPVFSIEVSVEEKKTLRMELLRSLKLGNFTPEELLESIEIPLTQGSSRVTAHFQAPIEKDAYYFVKLCEDPSIKVRLSDLRLSGVLCVTTAFNKAVAKSSVQEPPAGIGIDRFEFWLPKRRPQGLNLAMTFDPAIDAFSPANVIGGPARPVNSPNAWVADPTDKNPELQLTWSTPKSIARIQIEFDPDWDHPMESVLMTHPEETVPFLVKDFDLIDEAGYILVEVRDNHSARFVHTFETSISTSKLKLQIHSTHGTPAAVFQIRVFA